MEVDESFQSENQETKLICNVCKEEFNTKDALMKHKKKEHPDKVRPCTDYSAGTCIRSNEQCWYGHTGLDMIAQNPQEVKDPSKTEETQVFQEASKNFFPPNHKIIEEMLKAVGNLSKQQVETLKQIKTMEEKIKALVK